MFKELLENAKKNQSLPDKFYRIFLDLYESWSATLNDSNINVQDHEDQLVTLLQLTIEQLRNPYRFQHFHRAIEKPFNYYRFGLEFFRPLVDLEKSRVFHLENVEKIEKELASGENVILFANHQTEADPQLMSLALEKDHETFAKELIFVAGDRVVTDPLAVPQSLGRNLLCIFSKRHIENPPELKTEKLLHNQRAMAICEKLLSQGGVSFFLAPSGGRDRQDRDGVVQPAPFDPDSIELFRLIAKKAVRKTHFYPLAVSTFDILPPPYEVENEIGEKRASKRSAIAFSFCDEIDFSPFEHMEKKERRIICANAIHQIVLKEYWKIKNEIMSR